MPISYYNPKQFIRLNAYADLIIYEKDPSKLLLRAIRFGGEPEMVRVFADALYAGAELEVEVGPDKFYFASEPRKFQRQLSHDGIYAEAVLLALDDEQAIETEEQSDEQQRMPQTPRNCFIFGPVDDRQYLFEEIDRKTTVSLIPAFREYLLEQAAFLRLTDMGKDLPEYEEIPIPVSMQDEVKTEYKRLEKTFVSILRRDPKIKRKIMSAFINLLTVYPDQPYGQESILHPADREPLVEPAELGNFDTLGPKEQAVFDLAQKAIANGEKVLVYTSWVRVDSQQKLQKLFVEHGYRTAILPATVKTEAREEWVQHQLSKGMQILIILSTNPSST